MTPPDRPGEYAAQQIHGCVYGEEALELLVPYAILLCIDACTFAEYTPAASKADQFFWFASFRA